MTLVIDSGGFAYAKARPILRDISLEIASGTLLAVLGPNGAGKTTLLRCLIGLQPWTTGVSTLDGVDIARFPAAMLWRRISYVPQARSAAALSLTGLDMVTIGRSPHLPLLAQPGATEAGMALVVMEEIGIAHLADIPCGHMSGGQLQMVLIARALVAEPEVLILDEPETGLDFRNQLIVLDLLRSLVVAKGISVVMNTHYPSHALRIADEALLLRPGGLDAIHGDTSDVITEANLRAVFDVNVHLADTSVHGRDYRHVIPLSITPRRPGPYAEQDAVG